MGRIGVATDSNSGIRQEEAMQRGIYVLPMPFQCGEESFLEGKDLTREKFFEEMKSGKIFQTAQPSPEAVMDIWRAALSEHEEVVYIPMSSALSGSCGTAQMLSREPEFENKVFVVDNGRVATPLHRSVLDALELAEEGYTGAQIKEMLEAAQDEMVIYVGLETLEYLKRGGRISGSAAVIGTVLNLKPIMKFSTGLLDAYKKCRGMRKARSEMIQAMKQDLATRFSGQYKRGEIYLMAASSADPETTNDWVQEIQTNFPEMDVVCDDLPISLSCHIGEGGLGIGCSCRIRR